MSEGRPPGSSTGGDLCVGVLRSRSSGRPEAARGLSRPHRAGSDRDEALHRRRPRGGGHRIGCSTSGAAAATTSSCSPPTAAPRSGSTRASRCSRRRSTPAARRAPTSDAGARTGEAIPLRTDSVGGCRIDRVLQHVADPAAVLSEAFRCVRPGGLLTVFEPDWLSLQFPSAGFGPDASWLANVRQPAVGRRLTDLVERAGGLVLDRVEERSVWTSLARAERLVGIAAGLQRQVERGRFTPAEARRLARGAASQGSRGPVPGDLLQGARRRPHLSAGRAGGPGTFWAVRHIAPSAPDGQVLSVATAGVVNDDRGVRGHGARTCARRSVARLGAVVVLVSLLAVASPISAAPPVRLSARLLAASAPVAAFGDGTPVSGAGSHLDPRRRAGSSRPRTSTAARPNRHSAGAVRATRAPARRIGPIPTTSTSSPRPRRATSTYGRPPRSRRGIRCTTARHRRRTSATT